MTGTITPIGIGAAPGYSRQASAGAMLDVLAEPDDTNAPIIFEPPPALTGGNGQVWIIATGGVNWGGCEIFLSTDGTTYGPAGVIAKGGRQGVLSAPLASGADPDTLHTLSVDLSESQGQLLSGTTADADNLITLCLVDEELISYETATLTSAYHYELTYLRRGAMGTQIQAHLNGAPFARISLNDNETLFRLPYPPGLVGQTLYVKLPGFNQFGQMLQDLADVAAYTHEIEGNGVSLIDNPLLAALAAGGSFDFGHASEEVTHRASLGHATQPVGLTFDLGHAI